MPIFAELPKPAIFAHRGASVYAPENTLAAFQLAVQQGADGIELDVHLTKDGHVVVAHDDHLERTTGFNGRISELSLAEIKQLDAGSFFDSLYQNERIPALVEVLELLNRRIVINIELKNLFSIDDRLPQAVADLVKQFGMQNRVFFSSFNPLALRQIKKFLPQSEVGLLALQGNSGWWARGWPGRLLVPYEALHPAVEDVSPSLIQRFHRKGIRVHTYTVNEPNLIQKMIQFKVDGFFTDDPLLARKIQRGVLESSELI
jgi:glycerophosphoryl diester phosphodiesterase